MKSRHFLATANLATLLLAFAIPLTTRALNVGGTLATTTTWTTNDSPYVLTGALTVSSAATLTIEPGVTVHFQTNVLFTVRGTLRAEGTPELPIAFSAAPALSARGGLTILGSNYTVGATGILAHCDFTRMAAAPAIIVASFATLDFRNCVISNITSAGLRPVDCRVALLDNLIHDTAESMNAVRCTGVIASNFIHDINGNADAIDIDLGWNGPGDRALLLEYNHVEGGDFHNADGIDLGTTRDLVMRYNRMHNFGDKGISIGEGSEVAAYNNLIYDCIIGIAIKDSSTPLIYNTTIARCAVGIDNYEKNAGLGGGNGAITNVIIWDCPVGIQLDGLSVIQVGYSIVPGATVWPGPGNSNADPLFADSATFDFHARPGSAARDAGLILPWMAGATDFDGNPRIAGASVDMGAFEFLLPNLGVGFSGTPLTGLGPLAVVFTATADGTATNGLTYAWDFDGNGTPDLSSPGLPQVTNLYADFGTHSPSLTVSNDTGDVATQSRTNYISVYAPAEVFISPAGAHLYPFTNWATAATNLQDALALASGGNTLWATSGTYRTTAELILPDAHLRSVAPADATIIDGQHLSRVLRMTHTNAWLENFTVTGGSAFNGGGILLEGGRVSDCRIVGNASTNVGGGIELRAGTTVERCTIASNRTLVAGSSATGADGGGAYLNNGGLIQDCIVIDNRAADDAGGIVALGAGTIRRTLLRDNVAKDKGGAIFLDAANGVAESCLIVSNRAAYGGGVTCRAGGRFENCTVVDNVATNNQGGGLYAQNGGGVSYNTIYWTNTAATGGANLFSTNGTHTYRFCDTAPLSGGGGNISADPQFVNLASHDLRLTLASPCIDTGTNRNQSLLDLDRSLRPLDGDAAAPTITDMGAYEFFNLAGDTDGDGMPDGWEQDHGFNIATNDANADGDGDSAPNGAEYIAGTDPLNDTEVLTITAASTFGGGNTLVAWPTVTNRLYLVQEGPAATGAWTTVHLLDGSGAPGLYTNTAPPGLRFLRIGVQFP